MKKRIKAVYAGILVLVMLLVLAGCGADEGKQSETSGESVSAESSDSIEQESASGETEAQNETSDTAQVTSLQNDAAQEDPENGGCLVVYFSRTGEQYGVGEITKGNTAIVADMIIEKTGADSFEILPEKDYYPYTYDELTDVAEKRSELFWLSRTVEVQENQKVVDTGLYGVVRHKVIPFLW